MGKRRKTARDRHVSSTKADSLVSTFARSKSPGFSAFAGMTVGGGAVELVTEAGLNAEAAKDRKGQSRLAALAFRCASAADGMTWYSPGFFARSRAFASERCPPLVEPRRAGSFLEVCVGNPVHPA